MVSLKKLVNKQGLPQSRPLPAGNGIDKWNRWVDPDLWTKIQREIDLRPSILQGRWTFRSGLHRIWAPKRDTVGPLSAHAAAELDMPAVLPRWAVGNTCFEGAKRMKPRGCARGRALRPYMRFLRFSAKAQNGGQTRRIGPKVHLPGKIEGGRSISS